MSDLENRHTPTPWVVDDASEGHVMTVDGYAIADCVLDYSSLKKREQVNNARRIVACVNACAGLDTDPLERFGLGTAFANELHKITNERDELLAALKESRETLERENAAHNGPIVDTIWHTGHETLFDFMDAAIAKAEAGQ